MNASAPAPPAPAHPTLMPTLAPTLAPEMIFLSEGDTSFMLVCAALVQLMTPGLALFYGGLVKHRSVLTMMSQNFVSLGVTSVLWYFFLFSLCFGPDWSVTEYVGDPTTFAAFRGVTSGAALAEGGSGGVGASISGVLFALYQGMFAIITPALMTGAFADRLRFVPWLLFLSLWLVFVYAPWAHTIWGGGYFAAQGVQDFAGGIVVHTTAGFSALACIFALGKRQDMAEEAHSVPIVFVGTALLWFGWFGFNCGSALKANSVAVSAGWNSQIAAATAMVVWALLDSMIKGKPSLVGKCVGTIAGLATITPAAGFIGPFAALLLGALASVFCYFCVTMLNASGMDDALDVWGVHGMGGFLGTCMIGLLADGPECMDVDSAPDYCVNPGIVTRSLTQLKLQFTAAAACALYSFGVSYLLIRGLGVFMRLVPTAEEQEQLDLHIHGEEAYSKMPESNFASKDPLRTPLMDEA